MVVWVPGRATLKRTRGLRVGCGSVGELESDSEASIGLTCDLSSAYILPPSTGLTIITPDRRETNCHLRNSLYDILDPWMVLSARWISLHVIALPCCSRTLVSWVAYTCRGSSAHASTRRSRAVHEFDRWRTLITKNNEFLQNARSCHVTADS
ncbi:hypothetical protein EV401DRAFT_1347685 [Pisolithus croceorrhizus]|nr:hypothetical protein EV401DRAFT_1347685 [Pisolithus croceorrhizus]